MPEHIAFRFDWHEVEERKITAVLGLDAVTMNDGSAASDAVAICVGETAVLLTVEIDTAEVIVAREATPCGEGWQSISSFEFAVGRTLGWSWIGINSQGYKDSVTIAFGPGPDGIDPRCTFVTDGSCGLYCYDLVQRRA